MPGQKFADLQAGDGGGNRSKRASIFTRSQGLGIVSFQVAGPAVQPNNEKRRSLILDWVVRPRTQPKQARQREIDYPRQSKGEEMTTFYWTVTGNEP